MQALGNAFAASPRGVNEPVIRLDGDDRSGTNTEGENLFINLGYASQIKRVLVFALIYQGAANWAAANGVVTLYPATGPQVEVRLDETRDGARICGIALLESSARRAVGPARGQLHRRQPERAGPRLRLGHELGAGSQVTSHAEHCHCGAF